jgi:hypothetical protein
MLEETDEEAHDGDSSWLCFLCGKDSEEGRIQCVKCRCWVNTRCAEVETKADSVA